MEFRTSLELSGVAMLGMFSKVQPYLVPKPKVDVPRPDNAVFRFHYKASNTVFN